jgi:predicted ATPase
MRLTVFEDAKVDFESLQGNTMAILEGIQIQNYRALRDVTLGKTIYSQGTELPRLMAVIGANGVGKSSLLDALGFIGDCLAEGVESACDKPHRGGFERLRTQGSTDPIKFEIRYRENPKSRTIDYSLEIDRDKHGRPLVRRERLKQSRGGLKVPGKAYSFLDLKQGKGFVWAGESTEQEENTNRTAVQMSDRQVLGISSLGTLSDHPRISAFRAFLSGWYLSYFEPQLARSQPISGAEPHLDRTGENLGNYLQFIERQKPREFKEMLKRLGRKVPGLNHIKSDKAPDRRLFLEFQAQGYSAPFYQQDMSDGTLKYLAYLLLMEDPVPAPLIGIEEPENGLHHQLLSLLANEFKEFAQKPKGPQVLITTHAPSLVDALAPNEVWILDKNRNGFATVRRAADIPEVQAMFDQGIPMGSLWYSNHFPTDSPL